MPQLFTNNSFSTLASQALTGAGQIVLASGDGAKFPTPSLYDFFEVTLTQAGDVETSWEVVRCTARTGDTLTLKDALINTWPAGSKAESRITAGFLNGNNAQTRTASSSYNNTGSNTFSITSTGSKRKYATGQANP